MQTVKITKIQPYQNNAKKHPAKQIKQIAESIKQFGFNQPLVLDKDGVIIVGHGRFEAAKQLGMEELPVIYAKNLNEQQVKAYRLADNKLNESEWDMKLVIEDLKTLDAPMIDLTGFSSDLVIEPGEKDDEVPEVPEEPKAKLGDIYQLGRHRLMCGDSTSLDDVEKLMAGKRSNLVFTSFPYGVNLDYGEYQDTFENLMGLLDSVPVVWRDFIADGGYFITNFGDIISYKKIGGVPSEYPMGVEYYPRFNNAGYVLNSRRIWVKPHARVAAPWTASSNRAASDWEHIWVWIKPGDKWLNERRKYSAEGVWDTSKMGIVDVGKDVHPAGFPVALVVLALKVYSNENAILVDMFGGTGSSLIAAEKTNRTCYMMELDPKYVDVIIKRYEQYTGKKAERVKSAG